MERIDQQSLPTIEVQLNGVDYGNDSHAALPMIDAQLDVIARAEYQKNADRAKAIRNAISSVVFCREEPDVRVELTGGHARADAAAVKYEEWSARRGIMVVEQEVA